MSRFFSGGNFAGGICPRGMSLGFVGGILSRMNCPGEFLFMGKCPGGMFGEWIWKIGGVWLTHRHRHRQTNSFWLVTLLAHPPELKTTVGKASTPLPLLFLLSPTSSASDHSHFHHFLCFFPFPPRRPYPINPVRRSGGALQLSQWVTAE